MPAPFEEIELSPLIAETHGVEREGMTAAEYVWDHRQGRDSEGQAYDVDILVHGSGRILAKVHTIAYYHRAQFYFTAPKEKLDTTEAYDFMDKSAARAFVEQSLQKFDPLAPRQPKAARKTKTVAQ